MQVATVMDGDNPYLPALQGLQNPTFPPLHRPEMQGVHEDDLVTLYWPAPHTLQLLPFPCGDDCPAGQSEEPRGVGAAGTARTWCCRYRSERGTKPMTRGYGTR